MGLPKHVARIAAWLAGMMAALLLALPAQADDQRRRERRGWDNAPAPAQGYGYQRRGQQADDDDQRRRMSPEERQQLRRDIRDAGREVYRGRRDR